MDILRKLNLQENNVIEDVPSDAALVDEIITDYGAESYVDESYLNYLLIGEQLTNQDMSIDEKRNFVIDKIMTIKEKYKEE